MLSIALSASDSGMRPFWLSIDVQVKERTAGNGLALGG